MAGEKGGKDFLLKVEDSGNPGTFDIIGGLRSKSLTINNEAIDVTNHGSNQFRELLDGCGIRSMSISGSGIFNTSTTLSQIRTDVINGTLRNFQIVDDVGGDVFEGLYKITSFERAGEYNGEQTWSVSLESSGEVTVT